MDRTDQYLKKVMGLVEQHGHMIQSVMTNPPYSYTVGLHRTHALPELVVMGLAARTAQTVLNDLARKLKARALVLAEGIDFDEVFEAAPARFRHLAGDEVKAYLPVASTLNRTQNYDAWQLVWPDRAGRFAGDEGVDPQMVAMQDLRLTLA